MSLKTFIVTFCFFLTWQILSAFVQWDRSGVRWSDAVFNALLGPAMYAIIVPLYYGMIGYILVRDYFRQPKR